MLLVDQNLTARGVPVTITGDPESALLQRIVKKDHQAFQQLYLAYHERLYRFMFRMLQQHEQVSELVDDVMLIVWQKAGDFRAQSKISTWIMGIAHRTALKAYQRNKKQRQRHASDHELEHIAEPPHTGPENTTSLELLRQQIQHGLETLSVEKRSVVELTMQGYSYPEIADILECPVNTVKTRMFHARKSLKVFLKESSHDR